MTPAPTSRGSGAGARRSRLPRVKPSDRCRAALGGASTDRRRAIALIVPLALLAALLPAPLGASATIRPAVVPIGSLARLPAGSSDLGSLAPSTELTVGLALRPRDSSGLAAYAAAVSTPGSPRYHRFLSTAEFAATYGPSSRTLRRVIAALHRLGLSPGVMPADHLLLPIRASVGRLEQALHTHFEAYHLVGGASGFADTVVPLLPASIAPAVSAVLGLDDLVTPHASFQATAPRSAARRSDLGARSTSGGPHACAAAASSATAGSGWTPDELAQAYGLDRLYRDHDTAAGQTIAVVELEPFASSDLATFERCFFGVAHSDQVNLFPVDGFDLTGPGTDEAALDVEELAALAPSATLDVYEAPNTTFGTIDEYATIVSEDRANIVSTSWGECESALIAGAPGAIQVENSLFEEAAAEGQTWFAASGDEGADDCAGTRFSSTVPVAPYLSVDDPGAQPYVVSVGGTSLTSDRQPIRPDEETVWNDGAESGGTGGGYSGVWPMPTWQADASVPGLAPAAYRATPDVSASADQSRGIVIYASGYAAPVPPGLLEGHTSVSAGSWTTIGGTSAAAPMWAAVAAEIAASGSTGTSCSTLPVTAGGTDLGFISPLLYEVAASDYASSFTDVQVGNNDVFGNGLGYAAGPGYDLASGLGSPIVTSASGPGLAASLCATAAGAPPSAPPRPEIGALSPNFGPTSGGNAVTITLASAPGAGAAVHVTIGSSPATVTAISGATIVVDAPAALVASGSPSFGGAGPATVAVSVTSGGTTATSIASASATYDYVNETDGSSMPTVTGIGPDVGNLLGGETVTVYGSGFGAGDEVSFGGEAAASVAVVSDYALRAVVPAESAATTCATGAGFDPANACQVEVEVTNSSGTSATTPILPGLSGPVVFSPLGVVEATPETEIAPAPTEFDYGPTPHISAITPEFGDLSGRQPITITGSGFNIDTFDWVNFGPPAATQSEQIEESYISGTKIVIQPPPAPSDDAKLLAGGVSVQSGAGLSNVVRFGYAGIPRVTSLSVHGGPTTGGTAITVRGADLSGVTSVRFVTATLGGVFSQSVSSDILRDKATRLVVVSPAGPAGSVDVEPCTPSGCASANPSADRFVFYGVSPPTLSAISPASGPAAGGNVVVLRGSNLAGATAVDFGTVRTRRFARPQGFPLDSPTELAVVVPAGRAGSSVVVRVVTRAGTSALADAPHYRYA